MKSVLPLMPLRFSTILALVFMLGAQVPALAHKDYVVVARAITFDFRPGERAIFSIDSDWHGKSIKSIIVKSGGSFCAVPANICAKLHDLRFDTIVLGWGYPTEFMGAYFFLRFNMGREDERKYGELPQVDLLFENGKFLTALRCRRTGSNEWTNYPL